MISSCKLFVNCMFLDGTNSPIYFPEGQSVQYFLENLTVLCGIYYLVDVKLIGKKQSGHIVHISQQTINIFKIKK
jgi:hypothetical protein